MVFLKELCNSLEGSFLDVKVFLTFLVSLCKDARFGYNCPSPDCNENPFSCAFRREKIVVESGKWLLILKKATHKRLPNPKTNPKFKLYTIYILYVFCESAIFALINFEQ